MILIFTWQAPRSSAVKSIQKWIAMREKMDGILFICQTTHRLKQNWNRKELLICQHHRWETKKEKINHEFFFKKRPTTTLCLYCNDFMEVLTNKIVTKSEKKMYKNWKKGEKSNDQNLYTFKSKLRLHNVKKSYKKVSLSFFFASFWGKNLIFTIANETVLEFRFFAHCVIVAFFRSKKLVLMIALKRSLGLFWFALKFKVAIH